jgi:hypothetical protein
LIIGRLILHRNRNCLSPRKMGIGNLRTSQHTPNDEEHPIL